MSVDAEARPTDDDAPTGRRQVARIVVLVVLLAFAAFWVWALFFASKEAVNKIDDRAWAERGQAICEEAKAELDALADHTWVEDPTPELIAQRADAIDQATDVLERMLDDVVAVEPTDTRGIEIVPMWEADYRTWIQDRRTYAEELRASRVHSEFYETSIGIPISDKVATFAGDNEMPACAPPTDL